MFWLGRTVETLSFDREGPGPEGSDPGRDTVKVAHHFSGGKRARKWSVPSGTIDMALRSKEEFARKLRLTFLRNLQAVVRKRYVLIATLRSSLTGRITF
jgi:hypothetical protein